MNLVDLIIIILLIAAIRRGSDAGFVRIFSYAGAILGLLIGAWIAPKLVAPIDQQLNRLLIVILLEVVFAVLLSTGFKLAALKLQPHIHRWRIRPLATFVGVGFEIMLTLGLVWLLASLLSNARSLDVGRQVRQSAIVQGLNDLLPPAPDVLARIEKAINLNDFPEVFVGEEPQRGTVVVNGTVDRAKIDQSLKSVVQIYGFGCGGIVEGSGYVAADDFVVTNAHVVAGVTEPKVQDRTGKHAAEAVYVNKDLDVAVLRVPGLDPKSLPVNTAAATRGSPVVAAGYPGGGSLTLSGGAVLAQTRAIGRDIYNRGFVTRQIYEFQADVEAGNSGGPLLDANGNVIGIVFAKAVTQDNVGYALLISQANPEIQKAIANPTPVSTGRCAAG